MQSARWLIGGLLTLVIVVAGAQDLLWRQPILNGQAVALSPDGQYLAVSAAGGQIALYRTSDYRLVRVLRGHSAPVNALAFAPNSQRLASAGDDGRVILWQVSTGASVATINAHAGAALAVAFSPDGTLLATGGTDNTARLWNAGTGAAVRTLSGHTAGVASLAFTANSQTLATGSWDGTARLWRVSTGEVLITINAHATPVWAVALSPDGTLLATGSNDGEIRLWSTSDGGWLRTLSGHADRISSLIFTPGGARLLSGSWDASIRAWNPADGSPLYTITGLTREVMSMALSPDGSRLTSGGGDGVRFWRVSDGAAQGALPALADTVYGVGFITGGSVISAGFDATLRRWNASDGSHQQTYAEQDSPILALAVSPDGALIATGDWNGTVVLRSMPGGAIVRQWSVSSWEIKAVAFSPDGTLLATASMDGTVQLWAVATGGALRSLSGHTGGATAVAFAPDSALIATGDSSGVVRLWNAGTGALVRTLNAHTESVTHLAFSPDGTRLASTSTDANARIWDVATGTEFITLSHTSPVSRAAFTPDGSLLITTSWDGVARIWTASSGALYRQLSLHDTPVYALALSPDGQAMLTGGEDGLAMAWITGPPNQPPDVPVLVSPAENASLTSRTPTFQVQVSDPDGDQVQATVEITDSQNRTRTYTSGLVNSGTTISFGIPTDQPLLPDVYRWRARATDAQGASSAWSQPRTLTIANQAPGKPTILEPADNATLTATPTFRLRLSDPDGDSVRAVIEITGNNQTLTFQTGFVASGSEVSFTVPQSQALSPGSYTWRAKAQDNYNGESGWTDPRRFTVPQPDQPPDVPVLVSPSDGSTVAPTPTFRVRVSDPNGDTVKAVIEITALSGGTRTLETGFVASGSEASVSIPTSQPLSAGSYTWRARAQDSHGNLSDWSGNFAFTVSATNRPPDVPVLVEPADNAQVTPTPTFRVRVSDPDGDTVSAIIQITPPSGVPFEFTTSAVSSGTVASFTVPQSQALSPGSYTWRARARDNQDAMSDWTPPIRFTVPQPDNPPGTPELLAPADGAYTSRTPIFRLRATDPEGQPVSFEIQITTGSQTLTFSTDQVPSGSTLAFPVPESRPLPEGTLRWQARARDVAGNWSNWSATRTLNISAAVPQRLQGVRTFALSLRTSPSDPGTLGLNGVIIVRWNAIAQQYTSVSQLQPGEGYFIKATTPIQPNLYGNPITGEIVIPLQPGWNLIANPTLEPIEWDLEAVQVQQGSTRKSLQEAQQSGWLEDYLWVWQQSADDPMRGQYALVYDPQVLPNVAGTLAPWQAYWILAREECTLVLNASRGRQRGAGRPPAGWALRVDALSGTDISQPVWFGITAGRILRASPAPAPPPDESSPVQLRLIRAEGYFATDFRSELSRGARWTLEVVVAPGNQSQVITLRFGNLLRLPRGVSLMLVDERTGARRPLRTAGHYTFTAPPEGGRFRFTIEPVSSRVLLRVLNPSVQGGRGAGNTFTLRCTLTAEARLQVQIRAGGRTVRTLGDARTRGAGVQELVWDGRDDAGRSLPPGSYLAELVALGEDGQVARAVVPILLTR